MSNDSFQRWQNRTIEQLGSTSNLIIGLAGGGLALTITVLREDKPILTAQIARNRTKQKYTPEEVEDMRADSRAYGEWTWRFFVSQLILFAVGAVVYVFFLWHVIPH